MRSTPRLALAGGVALALLAAACSSDIGSINFLPKLGSFESLSVGSGVQTVELRPVTAADLVDPQGQCAAGQKAAQGGIALEARLQSAGIHQRISGELEYLDRDRRQAVQLARLTDQLFERDGPVHKYQQAL